nr:iron-sulfur cluster assembly scaffold protein [uncultured Sphingomonas sp.]
MADPLYTHEILRLAASIPGQVSFRDLGSAPELRSPTCGSRLAMEVTLDDAGRVIALKQAVEACAFGQASAALVGWGAPATDAEAASAALLAMEAWLADETAPLPSWPGISVLDPARGKRGRHGAIILPFRALVEAIRVASA